MEKICKYCNTKFTTTHANKNHCSSDECKTKYHHERSYVTSICPVCNISFEHRKSKPKTYCSKKCTQSSPDVINKMISSQKKTYMRKYGVDHPMKTFNTKNNLKVTLLERYGTEHALQNVDLLQKQFDTKLNKYGNRTYGNTEKIKNTLLDKSYDNLKLELSKKNISLLSDRTDYMGYKYDMKYKMMCNCGNVFESNVFKLDTVFCYICNPEHRYQHEYDIYMYLTEILGKDEIIIRNNRKILNGKELDFYLPERNVAIEFDGIYWHSELSGQKSRNYHLSKTKECELKGIKLFHIFELDWIYSKDKVKSILKNYFNIKSENIIYARNCIIKIPDNKEKNIFLDENHLQGKDISNTKLGLYYNDELVSIMTFSKSRFNKNVEWELSRYVNKLNYNIIGGASKLFSYFIKNYNPTSIITYADRRYFDGNVYNILGFKFISDTSPNYWYINENFTKIYNRITFQKHKLNKILSCFDNSLSEWENMKINRYDRIWDCGNKKFIWNKTK